jgi:DNA-binding beta-propeller fold protein YncE
MTKVSLTAITGGALIACFALAQTAGPYKVVKTAKTGGEGGFDYIYADSAARKLYIPRPGQPNPRIDVFNLDTLAPVGTIPNANARGTAIDAKSGHGFVSSKPVVMFDAKTLAVIKKIPVDGGPDGIMADPSDHHVYIFSHSAPNATVIDAADGAVLGTIDLGGAPEAAVSDGKGHVYVDLEDKGSIAVVDAKTRTVTAHYDIHEKGDGCAGLGFDVKNEILFATCRNPAAMVMVNAKNGSVITSVPIDPGTDGGGFNPNTNEAFSAAGKGTLTVVKENSPTSFAVEQVVKTMTGAKTMTIDGKTNRILTMGAEYGPAPAAAPSRRGRGPGRGPMVADSFTILAIGK